MNRPIIIASLLLLVASNVWAYSESDLARLKATNACEGCDLSGASLRGTDLTDANLTDVDLRFARLDDAKYCKTKMPWGELNDHCEE